MFYINAGISTLKFFTSYVNFFYNIPNYILNVIFLKTIINNGFEQCIWFLKFQLALKLRIWFGV